ncbi:malate synthase A [Micromonospora sp. SH-82]|uniref:malate synthase A n=1 Tax=Micromonospora sp. SH-82 TaxID=3132938 RepID=UPI003EB82D93
MTNPQDVDVKITGEFEPGFDQILTPEAVAFVAELHRRFGARRDELMALRVARQAEIDAGNGLDFLPETAHVREGDWRVAPPAPGLVDRRAEITGPTDRKMTINALNSGAKVWLADFEDAITPTWSNVVSGQINLRDALDRNIDFSTPDGKSYALGEELATIVVRPRGWHLVEKHFLVDGQPVAGALVDFGLYFFHCAQRQIDAGRGPYFYLPKLESHLEARLWNDIFVWAQQERGIPQGTIRATVLIETYPAAFEMEEILYELREHSAGLNAGRWDYLFSIIKKYRNHGADFVLPDRNSVTMTAPFMQAYCDLLVRTCHSRGAHAIGGMAAFIPSRRDEQVNATAFAKVREDKTREATIGFDGSWVAHPDLVPLCREVFDGFLTDKPNQLDRTRDDVKVDAAALLDVRSAGGEVTEAGLRNNVSAALQYLAAWTGGLGAVAIFNLMEDAATAEIARSQVWQWVHNDINLADGRRITRDLVEQVIDEEIDKVSAAQGSAFDADSYATARALFVEVSLADEFVEFLTLPAYERMP